MKTQSIGVSTSFGGLKRDPYSMSKAMFETLSQAPAVKKFGKNYDATLSVGTFFSSKSSKKPQLALRFEDIKPISFFAKVKQLFSKKLHSEVRLKTHAVNDADFIKEVSGKHSNTVLNIYNG